MKNRQRKRRKWGSYFKNILGSYQFIWKFLKKNKQIKFTDRKFYHF
ncbi:unnamed protein product [Paramecium primaurelia]|uniref:Uncharacterized protein n=1 Tax=Paramecium primaurelia TaxID=5886 RepID=A0A8S1KKE8_PARPR|nr:unnamed protein product [Paramecium primaurelia]